MTRDNEIMERKSWTLPWMQRDAEAGDLVAWMEARIPPPPTVPSNRLARIWENAEGRMAEKAPLGGAWASLGRWRRVAFAGISAAAFAAASLTPLGQSVAQAASEVVEYVVERALVPGPGHTGDQITSAEQPGLDEMTVPAP